MSTATKRYICHQGHLSPNRRGTIPYSSGPPPFPPPSSTPLTPSPLPFIYPLPSLLCPLSFPQFPPLLLQSSPLKSAMDLGSAVIFPNVVWSKAPASTDFVVFLEGKVHLASGVARNLNWAQKQGTEGTEI